MQCTKCNSENTQRLEMVFQSGTSTINTRSHSAGAGIGGAFGVGGVATKTSGTSQTVLGQAATPPAKKSLMYPGLGILIGLMFLNKSTFFIALPVIAISGYLGYVAFNYNKNEWPNLIQFWKDSWLCHKCGNIYHQK